MYGVSQTYMFQYINSFLLEHHYSMPNKSYSFNDNIMKSLFLSVYKLTAKNLENFRFCSKQCACFWGLNQDCSCGEQWTTVVVVLLRLMLYVVVSQHNAYDEIL